MHTRETFPPHTSCHELYMSHLCYVWAVCTFCILCFRHTKRWLQFDLSVPSGCFVNHLYSSSDQCLNKLLDGIICQMNIFWRIYTRYVLNSDARYFIICWVKRVWENIVGETSFGLRFCVCILKPLGRNVLECGLKITCKVSSSPKTSINTNTNKIMVVCLIVGDDFVLIDV